MNSLRVEGQKTISFEIAQQLGWEVPDYVVVPGGNLGNISAIANGFVLMKQMGLTDRIPRLVCAQAERANPFYRAYVHGFERFDPMTAGDTLATAIRIGNPVSFPKAVQAMKMTKGIVEQVTESELSTAANRVDRMGFFNDPQTGVALAATMKLARSGAIPKSSRVVVISTAHGLKFVDFKLRFHRGELPGTSAELANLPIEVPSNPDAIRSVIDERLSA
jgi:threonine synthase